MKDSPKVSVVEHFLAIVVELPVVSFSGIVLVSGDFSEAVVERQVVPDRVLPSSFRALVEREVVGDVLVDLRKRKSLFRRVLDAHRDQSRVGIRRADKLEKLGLVLKAEPAQIARTIFRSARNWSDCTLRARKKVEEHQVCHVALPTAPVVLLVHKGSVRTGSARRQNKQSGLQRRRRPWKARAGSCTCP